jgi:predicted Zn-dependent protease
VSDSLRPQLLVDTVLAASATAEVIAVVDVDSTVNLRWADNSLTTNGATTSTTVTVIAFAAPGSGSATGVATATIGDVAEIAALVEQAELSARAADPAADAQPLLDIVACCDAEWDSAPRTTSGASLVGFCSRLSDVLAAADAHRTSLYGYAEHRMASTWVGSGSGLRVRIDSPDGHLGITARRPGPDGGPRTSWVGRAFTDPDALDPEMLYSELRRRLRWGERRIELPAGRYDTVLPPEAVADLVAFLHFSLGARAALDGYSVWSGADSGPTRLGQRVTDPRVRLHSDPAGAGFDELRCADRVVTRASSADDSVFDNGLALTATDWIRSGVARSLITSRASAADGGLAVQPSIGNLLLTVDGARGTADELVAGVDRGLLLTSLSYLREVDPRRLLVTGLTRDGVYRVEGGEVVGEVNNFRFDESPLSVLNRFTAAGTTVPALSREWGEYFTRMAMPALRVPDFRMSSVSEAR